MNIPIIYSEEHKRHDPPYEFYDGVQEPYAEKAARIESIVQTLRENGVTNLINPQDFSMKNIYEIHRKDYVDSIVNRCHGLSEGQVMFPSYFIMDTYTPLTKYTFEAAKTAVDTALTGAKKITQGEKLAYSLCRPPGHHAEHTTMGGYCFFNNAAIAGHYLSRHGKVAILDIDFHHGNGTQHAFYDRADVLYVSIHADPQIKFPHSTGFANERGVGKGDGYNINYPLPLGITNEQYLQVLQKALRKIRDFRPEFMIVSGGWDTYEKDPIGGFKLTIPFYETMGRTISKLKIPTLVLQEGGYYVQDLGKIAWSFLKGIS